MRILVSLCLCFSFYLSVNACQCPLTQLNEAETNKYDIIFKGKITQVNLQKEKSELLFTITELYKGTITEQFTILVNNLDECKLEMREGDEWLIYTNFKQVTNAQLNFCSRSRKYFKNSKEDFFTVNSGLTYDEEIRYLQKTMGLHKCLKKNLDQTDVEHRNIIPTSTQFVVVILCSIVGLVFFYWLINRFLK